MAKKLSLLMASIAVVAFAVPAFASAAPAVTDGGVLLAKGAKIQGTNIGAVTTETSLGKLSCGTIGLTGELTANTGSTVAGVGIGTGTSASCTLGGSKAITITDITLKSLHSATVGSGTINVTFVADLPNGVVCHFESPNVPFTYTSGGDVVKVSKGDLLGTPEACEPGLLTGEFTVETDGGGAIILD